MKIAVIPARGGSKRIPRKNIRLFAGKPIIAYSIGVALESGLFDRVIVSTDDEEIAAVSQQWGAETPFIRPASLADDHTGTNAVVKHALEWFAAQGNAADFTCCIYATAPLLEADSLREGWLRLQSAPLDFVFSATTFSFPIWRGLRRLEAGGVEPLFKEYIRCRSQDLEEAYHDAGQFYWGRAEAFIGGRFIFGGASDMVLLPRYRVQDIDTLEDWRRVELMYAALTG